MTLVKTWPGADYQPFQLFNPRGISAVLPRLLLRRLFPKPYDRLYPLVLQRPPVTGDSVTPVHHEKEAASPAGPAPALGSQPATAPGYFPRLLSAAAHVTHIASDSALERFGLTQSSFHLLGSLASAAATEAALTEMIGQPAAAVRGGLLSLQASGYSAQDGSGVWSVTDAGRKVIECADLAQAEAILDADDSQELRQALRSLISSLRLDQPGGGTQQEA